MITLNKNNMLYSLLEQHKDGSWWYHPGFTFNSPEEVEECFKKHFDDSRPHMVFEHEEPMFQKHSTSSYDLKTFDFGGLLAIIAIVHFRRYDSQFEASKELDWMVLEVEEDEE